MSYRKLSFKGIKMKKIIVTLFVALSSCGMVAGQFATITRTVAPWAASAVGYLTGLCLIAQQSLCNEEARFYQGETQRALQNNNPATSDLAKVGKFWRMANRQSFASKKANKYYWLACCLLPCSLAYPAYRLISCLKHR